ncbi:MAG: nitroreductase family protein [Oscillospiraceae bacterium]|nr:nitroreductase family protein [Oscillospiraceae bacterium]
MTEAIKNIMERNSCRDFKDTPLTQEQLKVLIETALAAPSAKNFQPWHISVVTDKALMEDMEKETVAVLAAGDDKTFYERIMSRGGKIFYDAPCLIVISSNNSEWAHIDSGIMGQNIAIAAQSMGLGSCYIGMMKVPLNCPRGEEFKKRLQFPEGYTFAIAIAVGTVNTGKEPHELDFTKVSYVK